MWSRKRIDISWADLLFGLTRIFVSPDRGESERLVAENWAKPEEIIPCLSVRSGFDLFLEAAAFPEGCEILVSAVTIPDMAAIIRRHGLVPVPVDVEPSRMAPTEESWRRAITPATRAILVAHLFGGVAPMEPIARLAEEHGLTIIEDCAQAYFGSERQGADEADVCMFSFGAIKSNTALGGAILRVRNAAILEKMRGRQADYPLQSRFTYAKSILKFAGMKALSNRTPMAILIRAAKVFGRNYDEWINRSSRGFPGDDLFSQIRRKPCVALLAMLNRRMKRFDSGRLHAHIEVGRRLCGTFAEGDVCPGAANARHSFWVFPILAERPERMIDGLAKIGFDATNRCSLRVVTKEGIATETSRRTLEKIVFLPFYPEMPAKESARLIAEAFRLRSVS